jgi:hypothetical protein
VKLRTRSSASFTGGSRFLLFTLDALKRVSQELSASFLSLDPWPLLPRRIVPDVPRVPAFQFRNPVILIVAVKAGDNSQHVTTIRDAHRVVGSNATLWKRHDA